MTGDLPEHLQHWPGLFEWRDGKIVDAPAEDVGVAKGYPGYPDKGPLMDGVRLTVMTRRPDYLVPDKIRIIHVVEVIEPGRDVAVAGPKPVYGEYLDDQPVTGPAPFEGLVPDLYNGEIIKSPAVDYNYEITSYSLGPGNHSLQWRLGPYVSNILKLLVT
jgi:hypothetical protein